MTQVNSTLLTSYIMVHTHVSEYTYLASLIPFDDVMVSKKAEWELFFYKFIYCLLFQIFHLCNTILRAWHGWQIRWRSKMNQNLCFFSIKILITMYKKKIYSWKNNQKIWLKCHKTKNITLQSKKIVRIKQKTRNKKCIMTNIMTNMIYIVIKMNLTRVLTNVKSND